jgi:hypothetical protein
LWLDDLRFRSSFSIPISIRLDLDPRSRSDLDPISIRFDPIRSDLDPISIFDSISIFDLDSILDSIQLPLVTATSAWRSTRSPTM